jgi:hypothetical protein
MRSNRSRQPPTEPGRWGASNATRYPVKASVQRYYSPTLTQTSGSDGTAGGTWTSMII